MQNIIGKAMAALFDATPKPLASDVEGMTSPRIRKLLNSLVAELPDDEAYFEVGPLCGATLISALHGHKKVKAYACDDFSQFKEMNAKEVLYKNVLKYKAKLPHIEFFNENCFALAYKKPFPVKQPIGILFYDGDHTEQAQELAFTAFEPFLAKQCIVVVDDFNLHAARIGTFSGIMKAHLKVVEGCSVFCTPDPIKGGDPNGWWNGNGVFCLQRS